MEGLTIIGRMKKFQIIASFSLTRILRRFSVDLRRLAVTQTPVKDNKNMLV